MARYQIQYTGFPIPAPRPIALPLAQLPPVPTYRPVVPVRLDYENKVWAVYSILDSGADQCMFPGFVVGLLGLNVQYARVSMFQGAGSVNQVSLFFDNIGVTVGNIPRFVGTIAFSAALNQCGYGLLGQSEFFSRFKVEFDLPNKMFYVEDPPPPPAPAPAAPQV